MERLAAVGGTSAAKAVVEVVVIAVVYTVGMAVAEEVAGRSHTMPCTSSADRRLVQTSRTK